MGERKGKREEADKEIQSGEREAAGAEGAQEKKCGKQANQNGLSTTELQKKTLEIQEGAVKKARGCSLSVQQIKTGMKQSV